MSKDLGWLERRIEEVTHPDQREEPVPVRKPARKGKNVDITVSFPGQELRIRATSVKLHMDRDFVDATTFGDAHKTYRAGRKTFTITGECL